jgi:hypothetical protein
VKPCKKTWFSPLQSGLFHLEAFIFIFIIAFERKRRMVKLALLIGADVSFRGP